MSGVSSISPELQFSEMDIQTDVVYYSFHFLVNVYLLPVELFIPSHTLSIALLKHLSLSAWSSFIPITQAPAPEHELETLTGKRDWGLEVPPPEYASVMVTKDDTQPPDYFDDIVNKVVI